MQAAQRMIVGSSPEIRFNDLSINTWVKYIPICIISNMLMKLSFIVCPFCNDTVCVLIDVQLQFFNKQYSNVIFLF